MTQAEIDAIMAQGAQNPDLAELGAGVTSANEVPLAMLMDLTLPLSIELGRTRMTVQDILRLGQMADETLDFRPVVSAAEPLTHVTPHPPAVV